ncbi:hypothetical protein Bbelb_194210 [Branchiostoma belcheri]|nr:hypothetical protein Bbelb_194210 [Branchiostoma belcheri]
MVSFARAFKTYGIITGLVVVLSASSLLVHYNRGLGSAGSLPSSVNGREYAANSAGDSGRAANRTNKTSVNGFDRLVYNRVGKCGSRSLITILSVLSNVNGFNFAKDNFVKHWQTRFPLPEQIDIKPCGKSALIHETGFRERSWSKVKPCSLEVPEQVLDHSGLAAKIALVQHVDQIQPPFFYNRHFHYIDFTRRCHRKTAGAEFLPKKFVLFVTSKFPGMLNALTKIISHSGPDVWTSL